MSEEVVVGDAGVDVAGPSQWDMPYTDALRRYADLDYVRLDVPGHCGSALAQPELAAVFGERVLRPALVGVGRGGPKAAPVDEAAAQPETPADGGHKVDKTV